MQTLTAELASSFRVLDPKARANVDDAFRQMSISWQGKERP